MAKSLNPKKFEIPSVDTYKLDSILRAAALAKNPHFGRKTILVAGTNGKGSTCQYLTHLFLAAGFRVGTYTSPHLIHRTERIRLNQVPISEIKLRAYEKKYRNILAPLSYFERLTLLAFLYFRDQKVDLQILEVGIGGRLDATNISSPDFSFISKIDFDHQDVLGSRLQQIAFEKSGVMRKGRPTFASRQSKVAIGTLRKVSKALQSKLIESDRIAFSKPIEEVLQKISRDRGRHQAENARLALSGFFEAAREWGFNIPAPKIRKALLSNLPMARIQILRKKPIFLIDGSHNPNSVSALVSFLKAHQKGEKFEVVFGAVQDKPAKQMLQMMSPFARQFYFPTFYEERQQPPIQLLKYAKNAEMVSNLSHKILELWSSNRPVLVVGSLYLAGEVLGILKRGT